MRRMHKGAVTAGAIRCASGLSFLVAPLKAQKLWSQREADDPTARVLLRSMGYRDALIGGGLLVAGLTDSPTVGRWFLASGGADAADLLGELSNHEDLKSPRDQMMGMGGAILGVVIGLGGWARSRSHRADQVVT
jgi:hypothetical protein